LRGLLAQSGAFPSIKVSCSTRPACFPNRIITCAHGGAFIAIYKQGQHRSRREVIGFAP
jgi:hypothetical protein